MLVRRNKLRSETIDLHMTPMIDIVFQLLVFFILTFQVVAQEADFHLRFPRQSRGRMIPVNPTTLRVRLIANQNGDLVMMKLDDLELGHGGEAYRRLHKEICGRIDDAGGQADLLQVEFDADYALQYAEVIRAVEKISGNRAGGERINRMIENVRFSKRRPKAE